MTISSHIDALYEKHHQLEAALEEERTHPMPDFVTITQLKKRKLLIKEEIAQMQAMYRKRKTGSY